MNGYGFLFASLMTATVGIGLYLLGPTLDRWHARLQRDLSRLSEGQQR